MGDTKTAEQWRAALGVPLVKVASRRSSSVQLVDLDLGGQIEIDPVDQSIRAVICSECGARLADGESCAHSRCTITDRGAAVTYLVPRSVTVEGLGPDRRVHLPSVTYDLE